LELVVATAADAEPVVATAELPVVVEVPTPEEVTAVESTRDEIEVSVSEFRLLPVEVMA
jgi:hypothetical protein